MNRSATMTRFISILLVSLVLPTAAAMNAPEVMPTRGEAAAAPPALSPPLRSRKVQGNNKNGGGGGGNNKNDRTPSTMPSALTDSPTESPLPSPSPTSTPSTLAPTEPIPTAPTPRPTTVAPTNQPITPQPTTDAPSGAITLSPTRSPSNQPTATILPTTVPSSQFPSSFPTAPTTAPSSVPTIVGIIGYLNMSFAILAPGVTSLTLSSGQDEEFLTTVQHTVSNILCTDTGFQLLDDTDRNVCQEWVHRRRQQEGDDIFVRYAGESILRPDQTITAVQDRTIRGVEYTEWTIEYPVLQIGNTYEAMANENGDAESLAMMESVAQLALKARIEDGGFDERLETGEASIVGLELDTWLAGKGYYEPLNPAPLHGLRIAGIALLIVSFVVTLFITNLANKRRIEKEWDAEFKERGKGGLVTEEGLDYMLEAGRHQSADMTSQGMLEPEDGGPCLDAVFSDDDDTKLPLPGYMMGNPSSPAKQESKSDRSFDSTDSGFHMNGVSSNR